MKVSILASAVLFGCATLAGTAQAASNNGEAFQYNPTKFQQVCRGKSQGAPVSLAMNGVIFNGTCEVQYIPNSRHIRDYDPMDTDQACSGQQANASVSATINGKSTAGRCVLAYKNIGPNNASMGTTDMSSTAGTTITTTP